jgi:hypothetical protein
LTGGKAKPHRWIEENVFAMGLEKRIGVGARTNHTPPGAFSMINPDPDAKRFDAGPYALFTLRYDGAPAFSLRPDVSVPGGDEAFDAGILRTPAHYSVMYDTDYNEWGEKPWLWGDNFYQTFTATSGHVTRIATKLAGKSGDHFHLTLNFAVYEVNDGPPSTWKQISPVRSRFLSEGTDPIIHIFWVPFKSREVRLERGQRYAVRFWRDPKSQSQTFAMVVRRDNGDGYRRGHLYLGDEPRKDLDAYAYVSGGQTGTVVNHAPVGDMKFDKLIGTGKRFGQTFEATGVGLAAVEVVYATGDASPPRMPIAFQLYDRPAGEPIGPLRTCYGLPMTFQARAAVVWRRGEVELTPGKTYYLEWFTPGVNTWQLEENLPGQAYVDGKAHPDADLAMCIVEYARGPRDGARERRGGRNRDRASTRPATRPGGRRPQRDR